MTPSGRRQCWPGGFPALFSLCIALLASAARAQHEEGVEHANSTLAFIHSQHRLAEHFASQGHQPAPGTPVHAERGIIITAGGRTMLSNAFIVVKVVREEHNCTLPVEIYFDGQGEADDHLFKALEGLPDVLLRDASKLPRPAVLGPWPATLHGYAKKVFSLYATGFKQVLMLDADSLPLVDPIPLFALSEFLDKGNIFFPDYHEANQGNEHTQSPRAGLYKLLGLEEPWAGVPGWAAVESGQVLLDKERHADALEWIMWLNMQRGVTNAFLHGDKDTFEIGFMLAGKHSQFVRLSMRPRAALTRRDQERDTLIHVGMVQSVDRRPAFLHRTAGSKFAMDQSADEQLRPAFFSEPIRPADFRRLTFNPQGTAEFPAGAVVDKPPCAALDRSTLASVRLALEEQALPQSLRHFAHRYTRCNDHHTNARTDDIAILPIELYGQGIVQAIDRSFTAFQDLRLILGEVTT